MVSPWKRCERSSEERGMDCGYLISLQSLSKNVIISPVEHHKEEKGYQNPIMGQSGSSVLGKVEANMKWGEKHGLFGAYGKIGGAYV